jgi:stearoyl-CoA desaturase (delta-9 desaturase)
MPLAVSDVKPEDQEIVRIEGPARLGLDRDLLNVPQRIHAFAILVLPIAGTIAAVWHAMRYGIGALEIGLLITMYSVSWIGITVGYHRHFTHRSFKAATPVRVMLAVFGSIACQGPLNYWVSNHRRHHQFSDKPEDIHSPIVGGGKALGRFMGFWHSHIGWTFTHELTNTAVVAKDLLQDPLVVRLNRLYYLWLALGFAVPAAIGALVRGTLEGAMLGFLWGGAVRLLLCYHSTNTITSLTHMFGSQPFKVSDESRNNVWLAVPTWGEAWHNNHHAFPTSALFGLRPWQIDFGGIVIRAMAALGWVWNVNRPSEQAMARRMR